MWNEIEEPLLSLRAGNIPLERDLWEDFYTTIENPESVEGLKKLVGYKGTD